MPFRTLQTSELEYSTILRSHAMRVMSTVDKCIARLDNRQKLREMMTEMGIRHKNCTVKMEFIDVRPDEVTHFHHAINVIFVA